MKNFKESGCSPKHVSSHIYSVLSFLLKNDVMTLGIIVHSSPFVVVVVVFFFSVYLLLSINPPHPCIYVIVLYAFKRKQSNNKPSTRHCREQTQEYLRASKGSQWLSQFLNSACVMLKLPFLLLTPLCCFRCYNNLLLLAGSRSQIVVCEGCQGGLLLGILVLIWLLKSRAVPWSLV